MFDILAITFPIYVLIALGYATVRKGVFDPKDMRVFGVYVMNIALPAMLFNAVATRQISEVFNIGYMAIYLVGGLATMGVAYTWFTLKGTDKTRRAVAIMGTSSPNSGFVGYPVLLLVFPDLAGVALALNMLVENFVLIPISLALLEASRSTQEGRIVQKTIGVLVNVLKRPMIIALIAGLLVSLAGLAVPAIATKLLSVVAASASALALFVIGGSLVGLPLRANHWLAGQIVIGKLLVFPAMTALAVLGLQMFGPMIGLGPLGAEMRAVVILSSAMPMFGIYSLLAQEYGHEGLASIAQLIATIGAFFTLTLLLGMLT